MIKCNLRFLFMCRYYKTLLVSCPKHAKVRLPLIRAGCSQETFYSIETLLIGKLFINLFHTTAHSTPSVNQRFSVSCG